MKTSIVETGLEWNSGGYYAPSMPENRQSVPDRDQEDWAHCFEVLEESKSGCFNRISSLLEIYKETNNWLLAQFITTLVADAGGPPLYPKLLEMIDEIDDVLLSMLSRVDFSEIVLYWGRLSHIEFVVDNYISLADFDDIEILPIRIADILENDQCSLNSSEDFEDPKDYGSYIIARRDDLSKELGSPTGPVYRRKIYSVKQLAQLLLASISNDQYDEDFRRRFEAVTGIDCRPFYKDKLFQPLTAAAIVEDFLKSPEADKYEPGVRYFFGHRIPD